MKHTLTLITLSAILLSSCENPHTRVEQIPSSIRSESSICGSPHCVGTYIWFQGNIVYSRYDNLETITDSILLVRRKEAQRILDAINKMQ